MKADTIRIYRYQFSVSCFAHPRQSLILELVNDGNHSFSEIAPLPNWSTETLEEADQALQYFLSNEKTPLPPSVSFALDCTDLATKHTPIKSYPTAALLLGTFEEITAQAAQAKSLGITKAKIKLAPFSDAEAHKLLKQLIPDFSLRIDLNRRWAKQRVISFFSAYDPNTFDYLEEPCDDLDLPLNHSIAIDETARERLISNTPPPAAATTLILKPTLTGGLNEINRYVDYAKEHNLKLALSSSFESDLGLYQIALLASYLDIPLETSGLGTFFYLSEHLLSPVPHVENGSIHFANSIPNKEKLELIDEYILSSL